MLDRQTARLELPMQHPDEILRAALALRELADELDMIAGQKFKPDDALYMARHKINSTSKRLKNAS